MMSSSSIYYFLIANATNQREIGSFIDNSITGTSINDFNNIVSKSKELLRSPDLLRNKSKRMKYSLENHNIYYIVTNSNIFYLASVTKSSKYCEQENLIFELIEDIDNQGIKKLVDKNGELTNVGRQNLKFSIEKYHESNVGKLNSSDNSKINKINTQINDIKNDMKTNVKNMLSNVNEMQDLDNKSVRIKDASIEFKKGAITLERKTRCRKYMWRIIVVGCIALGICLVLYLIFR